MVGRGDSAGDRPVGLLTFLFTDVERSTALLQRLGAVRYAELLERHRGILRDAIAHHGGVGFGTEGDAVFAVFGSPDAALPAAVAAQRSLATDRVLVEHALRVRMGIHTGEAIFVGGDYVGLSLHVAARVVASAHGGQILASGAAVPSVVSAGVSLIDVGEYRLRGVEEPVRLLQLQADGLERDFAPPRAIPLDHGNLPAVHTRLFGRDDSLAAVLKLLQSERLVTLTGPAGGGKTRLAIEAARRAVNVLATDEVWFVDLAPVRDGFGVPAAVAAALQVPPGQSLIQALRERAALVLLDNCEHVLSACAELAREFLNHAPFVRLLATSRERLDVAAERICPVPPLAMPEEGTDAATIASTPAVELFVEQARRQSPDFVVSEVALTEIAQICRRLDGLPLAIELAAARVGSLGVTQVSQRLKGSFALLSNMKSDEGRHQTLRAAINWSWELLNDSERVLLRRLSVFSGGFTLEAAEFVSATRIESAAVDKNLERLVEKSLVIVDLRHTGEARYRMLGAIREYAADRLLEADEESAIRDAHLEWALAEAASAGAEIDGPFEGNISDRLDADLDNVLAACDWALSSSTRRLDALRLLIAAGEFWLRRAHHRAVLPRLEAALATGDPTMPASMRASAMLLSASLLSDVHGPLAARDAMSEAVEALRATGPSRDLAIGLTELARIAGYSLSDSWCESLLAEAEQVAAVVGDDRCEARVLATKTLLLAGNEGGVLEVALADSERALTVARRVRAPHLIERALVARARTLRLRDLAAAAMQYDELIASLRQGPDELTLARAVGDLAQVRFFEGRYREAAALLEANLFVFDKHGTSASAVVDRCRLAIVALQQGRPADARAALDEANIGLAMSGIEHLYVKQALALADRLEGNLEAARGALHELVAEAPTRASLDRAYLLHELGDVERLAGRPIEAERAFRAAGKDWAAIGCTWGIGWELAGLASVLAERSPELATTMLGAGDRLLRQSGAMLQATSRFGQDALVAALTDSLDERFAIAWDRGAELSAREASALAMSHGGIATEGRTGWSSEAD